MRLSGRPVRVLCAGLVITALACGAVVLPTGSATAAPQPSYATVYRSSWLSTDSRTPHHNNTTGDARVGSWRDDKGEQHTGKAYFTFDLAQLQGAEVFSAFVRLPEVAANDCAKPRATELRVVKPLGRISWARQPREKAKLPGPQALEGCLYERVTWDLGDTVRQTLAEGGTKLTVVARISAEFQDDVAYGRTYHNDPWIYIGYNKPPGKPTGLRVNGNDCGPEPMITASRDPLVSGRFTDPDGTYSLDARFAFWPVAAPESRREVFPVWASGGYATTYYPNDMLQDGGTYAWAVRGEDGYAVSEWSEPCTFSVDRTAPAAAPTVTSSVYREDGGPPGDGGDGVPGDFTFTANGVADVVAFEYSGIGVPDGRVSADQPGGSATVTVTPTLDGPLGITVMSIDRAGNRSPARDYRFWVRTTAPSVKGPQPQLGKPTEFTFTARQENAVGFTYRLDDSPETTLPLGPDGTAKVTITITDPEARYHELEVWTTNAAGQRSGITKRPFAVDLLEPTISIDPWDGVIGQRRTATFTALMSDAVSFTYRIGDGQETTVPSSADGTAQVSFTPTASGWSNVSVFSSNRDGVRSGTGWESFGVDGAAPTVTSAEYPEWTEAGGPGVPGTFTASSPLPGLVEYRYAFDGEPERTVAATSNGTASFVRTPTGPGWSYLKVRAVADTGLVSDERTYSFRVSEREPVITSPQYPPDGSAGGRVGEPIEFTFTAALGGSTEFVYRLDYGPETTVPVGPDGTATITFTPTSTNSLSLQVFSRTPEGFVSGTTDRTFDVHG
ncbi:hypothetical protein ACFFQW_11160 [Umezawaea endophytica]|uniref:Ig-like domain-containing protein n=1 Tax=Umezawaea endophytica TaxID=1654476 RepID=A0A9X2VKY8_9PSEU|nr:hypothetical protein [Umezawaea endophytica]MCS7478044.1 hypothetical protein [Umezawaea endophytica]